MAAPHIKGGGLRGRKKFWTVVIQVNFPGKTLDNSHEAMIGRFPFLRNLVLQMVL